MSVHLPSKLSLWEATLIPNYVLNLLIEMTLSTNLTIKSILIFYHCKGGQRYYVGSLSLFTRLNSDSPYSNSLYP